MDSSIFTIFKSLSKDIQETILSPETKEVVFSIANKHSISQSASKEIFDETILILLGLGDSEDLFKNLTNAGLEKKQIDNIFGEIEEKVFNPLQSQLIKLYKEPSTNKEVDQNNKEKEVDIKSEPLHKSPPSEVENKEQILRDIEEPKTFEVLMPKTAFAAKAEESQNIIKDRVPETKEEMLDELRGEKQGHTEKELPKDLFPIPKKELEDHTNDPYREQL